MPWFPVCATALSLRMDKQRVKTPQLNVETSGLLCYVLVEY